MATISIVSMIQSPPDVQAIQRNIELFLASPITTNRAPVDFNCALRKACLSVSNGNRNLTYVDQAESIFLNEGFTAWFAFFCAINQKLVDKEVFAQLTPEVIRTIATTVSATKLDASVVDLFRHLFWIAKRSPERRRYLESARVSLPPTQSTGLTPHESNRQDSIHNPAKRRRHRIEEDFNRTLESTDILQHMVPSNASGSQGGQDLDLQSTQEQPYCDGSGSYAATSLQNGTNLAAAKFNWPQAPPYTDYFDGDPAYSI